MKNNKLLTCRTNRSGGCPAALALMLTVLAAGCGTAEYEQRLDVRVADIERRAPFEASLTPAIPILSAPIYIRPPRPTRENGLQRWERITDPKDVRWVGVWPGNVVVGFPVMFFRGVVFDAVGGQYPYYFTAYARPQAEADLLRSVAGPGMAFNALGAKVATPPGSADQMDTTGAIYIGLQKTFRKFHGPWASVEFDTPSGEKSTWQRVEVVPGDGDQVFSYTDSNAQQSLRKLPGVIEILAQVRSGYLVVLAWRVPDVAKDMIRLPEMINLVCGAVTFEAPGGDAGEKK